MLSILQVLMESGIFLKGIMESGIAVFFLTHLCRGGEEP